MGRKGDSSRKMKGCNKRLCMSVAAVRSALILVLTGRTAKPVVVIPGILGSKLEDRLELAIDWANV